MLSNFRLPGSRTIAQSPNPEAQISQGQQRQQLLKAINRLPVPYRQVITLALEGLEYAEIAEVLGIGESNVGVRLSRARKLMRDLHQFSGDLVLQIGYVGSRGDRLWYAREADAAPWVPGATAANAQSRRPFENQYFAGISATY
jgi:Sigma-70, region 4